MWHRGTGLERSDDQGRIGTGTSPVAAAGTQPLWLYGNAVLGYAVHPYLGLSPAWDWRPVRLREG